MLTRHGVPELFPLPSERRRFLSGHRPLAFFRRFLADDIDDTHQRCQSAIAYTFVPNVGTPKNL
jgi:hypothetical protein